MSWFLRYSSSSQNLLAASEQHEIDNMTFSIDNGLEARFPGGHIISTE